nr:MAG TPA: hypothetical protein [Bacteriophage sp.]
MLILVTKGLQKADLFCPTLLMFYPKFICFYVLWSTSRYPLVYK